MSRKKSSKEARRLTHGALRPFHSGSLLEFSVVIAIIGVLFGMAIPVWSNLRKNAYDARASQNHERAEQAVERYWSSLGQKQGDYEGLTARYMENLEPGTFWIEANTSSLEETPFDEIPVEYFASILILKDGAIPRDEVAVATISETGKVYYTHFKAADTLESCQLAFSDFMAREGQHLQANVRAGFNPE